MNERMDWRIVESAPPPYAKCAISGFGDGPFLDFQVRMSAINPNVCVNVDVLKDAGRFVGMVDREEHEKAVEALDEARAQLDVLKRELADARQKVEAVDILASAGFTARKKPGRKPQSEKAVA